MIKDYLILKTDENPNITLPDRGMEEKRAHMSDDFPIWFYQHNFDSQSREHFYWHWHDEIELTIARSDLLCCYAGSMELTLHKGDCLLINSGVLHRVTPAGPADTRCLWDSLLFRPGIIVSADSQLYQKYVLPIIHSGREFLLFNGRDDWQKRTLGSIEEACHVFEKEDFLSELMLKNALLSFWVTLSEGREYFYEQETSANVTERKRLRQMMKFIWDHYQEHISLKDIADSANVSVSSAQRCFRNEIRVTPIEYLQKYRLQCARTMLLDSDLSILEAALACGFDSGSYFDRSFRKTYQETPSQYKKRMCK